MFSSGNVSEKERCVGLCVEERTEARTDCMSGTRTIKEEDALVRLSTRQHNIITTDSIGCLDCRGETVLDLYAGIGYYTLPIAVHGKAARVVACEWNPDACLALCHNVAANGVGDRVEVLFGDNRLTTRALPDGMAHRVRGWSYVYFDRECRRRTLTEYRPPRLLIHSQTHSSYIHTTPLDPSTGPPGPPPVQRGGLAHCRAPPAAGGRLAARARQRARERHRGLGRARGEGD